MAPGVKRWKDLHGAVAVVTGGGSGIGRGIALALAEAGADVAIADVDGPAADAVAAEVATLGVRSLSVETDVSKLASVEAFAGATEHALGPVDIVCNNAGVTVTGPIERMTRDDWSWVFSVNVDGVINGLLTFLPRLRKGEGPKHIVNTASGAGLFPAPSLGVYNATKYAVVAISETLHEEIGREIGVSVFCPGDVKSNMMRCGRLRPAEFGGPQPRLPYPARMPKYEGMDPLVAGRIVRQGILDDELYILSHPEFVSMASARFNRVLAAFEHAARRP